MLAQRGEFAVEIRKIESDSQSDVINGDNSLFKNITRCGIKDLVAFTSQLSAALRAGLTLIKALQILESQQNKPAMKALIGDLVKKVNSGESLSQAMQGHLNVFGKLYVSMVRVGETGGILEQTTTQMAEILAREVKVKSSMKNASAYPAFVLTIGIISVVIVVTWILPGIIATVSEGGALLPWPTRVLLALSVWIRQWGIVAIVGLIVGAWFFNRWRKGAGKVKFDYFKLRLPVLGSVVRAIAVGRFAKTLGALTKGGVTILESLSIVRDTLANEFLAHEIDRVADKVRSGSSVASGLTESGQFPPLLIQIVSMGEQTGKLDELLLDAADVFNEQADSAIARFLAIFPAVLIMLLAIVVIFIVAATLLPIVSMGLADGMM
jgi:type II secretory pathway component PulF